MHYQTKEDHSGVQDGPLQNRKPHFSCGSLMREKREVERYSFTFVERRVLPRWDEEVSGDGHLCYLGTSAF